ncbi:MAG: response regulator [Actinobacteria bacterium]|nr:MAG: response regulator [Actinomycetota bacterium]
MAPRVLVIDDEGPIRLLCRVNLEAAGMVVHEARDGASGVEAARRELPDVILLERHARSSATRRGGSSSAAWTT